MHVGDTIFIFCLALIIFGPKKLPEIGRQIGKLMVEFRRASNEFKMQIEEELRASEESERQKEITAAASTAPSLTSASASEVLSAAVAANDTSSLATPAATPTIAPPATGLPVNHTFALTELELSRESAVPAAEAGAASQDAYPDPGNGFNPGLNTASNGLAAEDAVATNGSGTARSAFGGPLAPEIETEKAQAPVHHG
jgi:sec-independent protein translocase protein TatB